jgi:hypothetical protein
MFIIPEFNPLVKPKVNTSVVTYRGKINTVLDALLVLEATRLELLPTINRRLTTVERTKYIVPNTIFVWNETKCGMKRWTDGKLWSPSKVYHGQFLIYKQLVKFNHQRQVDNNGLIKQSFSLITKQGDRLHLINYFKNTFDKYVSDSESDNYSQIDSSATMYPSNDPHLNYLTLPSDIYPDNLLVDIPKKNLAPHLTFLPSLLQTPPTSAVHTPQSENVPPNRIPSSTKIQKISHSRHLKPIPHESSSHTGRCYDHTDSCILNNLDRVYSL